MVKAVIIKETDEGFLVLHKDKEYYCKTLEEAEEKKWYLEINS